MDRREVQRRIAELEQELAALVSTAARRPLDDQERGFSASLERRIDRLRVLLDAAAGSSKPS